jgi:phosphoribosyl 1,2-cyclic phosphodiesterase
MKVTFWGVRGSLPSPLRPDQIRSKIAAVVQRIKPSDLGDQRTRELFLGRLPPFLFGTVGGNTTCLEIRMEDGRLIILDGGTGLRELGASLDRRRDPTRVFPLFFTHLHWDHLQGIPFFRPAFVKGNYIIFASPFPSMERALQDQMKSPYFPVTMDAMQAEKRYLCLTGESLRLGSAEIRWKRMNHPGGSYAYRISENGRVVIFATDSEVTDREFQQRAENRAFFEAADLLILDSQYTLEESFSRFDFGHTSSTMAVSLAVEWKVKRLVLFHHEPQNGDRRIWDMVRSAQWHAEQLGVRGLDIRTAQEGMEVSV